MVGLLLSFIDAQLYEYASYLSRIARKAGQSTTGNVFYDVPYFNNVSPPSPLGDRLPSSLQKHTILDRPWKDQAMEWS